MKTIEERADAYVGHPKEVDEFTSATIKRDAYIRGAKEQKAIDDEKLSRFKSSWEREAQINHNDEANYQQGFHDAIDKACEWINKYLHLFVMKGSILYPKLAQEFRKSMEE